MKSDVLCLGIMLWGLMLPVAIGQEPEPAASDDAAPADGETTLPELVVRPEPTPPAAQPASQPFRLPRSYPDLRDQLIDPDGLNQRSIFDAPELVTVIDRGRLEEKAPATTPQALEEEVGVLVQRTNLGGGSVFVRGLTGNQVLILVDGIRLNNSSFRFGPNQYLNSIDPGQIERIEVFRGPQSVLYGSDAIGGVINVVTRKAEGIGCCPGVGGSLVQRFTSSDTGLYSRLNIEATSGDWGIFAGGSYLDLNDLDPGGSVPRQDFTGYEQAAGDFRFDRMLDANNMFTAGISHLVQHDVPRTDKFVNSNEAFFFEPQQRDLFYLRWQGLDLGGILDAYRVTASFGRQQEGRLRQKFNSTTLKRFFDDVQTTGVNIVLVSDLDYWGRLSYGVDWFHDEVDSHRTDTDTATGNTTAGRGSFPDDSYYGRVGAYLQDDVQVTERLRATAGVRYTSINAGSTPLVGIAETPTPISPSFQDWTGSVALVYEVDPNVNLVGSVSEGFRAPGLDDLTALRATNQGVDVPSPGLAPETSWNYELGMKVNYPRLRGQVFGFWTYLDDLIVRERAGFTVDGTDAFVKKNAGEARVDGVEVAGEYLLDDRWSLYGNYMYIHGRSVTLDEPMSRIPPAQGLIGLRWRNACGDRWFEVFEYLVARQSRLSARDMDDPRIPPGGTPGYHTLNLRTGTLVGDNGKVSIGLENILDRHYRVHGSGIDAPGITAHLGYELFY